MRLHFIASLFLALPLLIGNRGASAQTGLFPAGSRHLYVHCEGQRHGPAVILDAGLFRDSTDWRLVQPEVARFTQVCSYDREGLGKSVVDTAAPLVGAGIFSHYDTVGLRLCFGKGSDAFHCCQPAAPKVATHPS